MSNNYDVPELVFNDEYTSTSNQIKSSLYTYDSTKNCNHNYDYIKKLVDGSQSTLFLGKEKAEKGGFELDQNKKYVIKRINKANNWKDELYILQKFKKLNCKRVLNIVDFYENYHYAYIITEYHGSNLLKKIKKFPLELNLKISKNIALCVKECHDNNIVHLDIKLDNLVVKNDNFDIILIDFGHAEILNDSHKDSILRCNFNYGTDDYLCPEGHKYVYSKKSDIWSFGVCMYNLITFEYLFDDIALDQEYITKCINKNIKDIVIKDLLLRCLDYDPEKRPTIDQILKCLN